MSVLINMEMPTSCEDCPMVRSNAEYDYAYCCVSSCETNGKQRPNDCPLVPVPPHGRLGDLDALMRLCVMLPRDGGRLLVVYASYVSNAPTIIPASEDGK